jgi:heme exporter protein D
MAFLLSFAALFPLDHLGHYIQWHVIQISVANLIVIILMVVTFITALLAPFPGRRRRKENQQ